MPTAQIYSLSLHDALPISSGAEFVSESVRAFARRLRAKPGKHIWMMGGGELIASFLDAGEIDEFDIHVIPTFIGEGIPLVAPRDRKSTRLNSSHANISYAV